MGLTNRDTPNERIAGLSNRTAANGVVGDYLAFGAYSASSRARIDAFLVEASLTQGAFVTGSAFRTASWRASHVVGQA